MCDFTCNPRFLLLRGQTGASSTRSPEMPHTLCLGGPETLLFVSSAAPSPTPPCCRGALGALGGSGRAGAPGQPPALAGGQEMREPLGASRPLGGQALLLLQGLGGAGCQLDPQLPAPGLGSMAGSGRRLPGSGGKWRFEEGSGEWATCRLARPDMCQAQEITVGNVGEQAVGGGFLVALVFAQSPS